MTVALVEAKNNDVAFGVTSRAVVFTGTPANDELIFLASRSSTSVASTPAGFAHITGSPFATGNDRLSIFQKVASGEAGATYTISWAGSQDEAQSMGMRFTGVDTTTPQDVTNTSFAADFPPEWPDIIAKTLTTVTAGAMHVGFAIMSDGMTRSTPSGYTSVPFTGDSGRLALVYKLIASPGATGPQTMGSSSGAFHTLVGSMALRPASGGGGATFVRPTLLVPRAAVHRASRW